MSLAAALESARHGRLYPAVILHGGDEDQRREAALALARTLLCAADPDQRPCGACRNCRRIVWPEAEGETFHPDFAVLERDLKTSTSVEGARRLVLAAQFSPFEARGQVFVVARAETLSAEAANSLLKALEEPGRGAPRHFLLLAPSQFDLLPTLRSRSLAIFLGGGERLDAEQIEALAAAFAARLTAAADRGAALFLLAAAGALAAAGGWEDPRAGRPWALAAAAVMAGVRSGAVPAALRRGSLALAEELLAAPALRVRGIPAERILEGLVSRHLSGRPEGAAKMARKLL
jgi:DNA polymerase III subunit delta'